MQQQNLQHLAQPAGRAVLQQLWHDLAVERRTLVLPMLLRLWRTACFAHEVHLVESSTTVKLRHSLGIRTGTRVFMEEIVVGHYFNSVQALVYLGAVILLIFLGLRFAGVLTENVALIGIGVEAMMLLLLFAVLYFTPDENRGVAPVAAEEEGERTEQEEREDDRAVIREMLEELEEISSSYASLGMKIERTAALQEHALRELSDRVAAIQGLHLLEEHTGRLLDTNALLARLVDAIEGMNTKIDRLVKEDVAFEVRRQLSALAANMGETPNGQGAAYEPEAREKAHRP